MKIETSTPIVFFDTETTGILKDEKWQTSSNGSLIQLASRKISWDQKDDQNLFVQTDTEMQIGAMAVHGIYPDLLTEKSQWKYLDDPMRSEIWALMTDNIIVAHNLDFDRAVLDDSNIVYGDKQIDTLKVAKTLWSEGVLYNSQWQAPEYVNLQYLRYFFELYEITDSEGNNENTTAHDAFGDVVVLEHVFYGLFDIIKKQLWITDEEVLTMMQEMTAKEFTLITTMRIGKYRGKSFEEVSKIDPGYLEWICGADFTEDIKYTCRVWLDEIEDKKFFG